MAAEPPSHRAWSVLGRIYFIAVVILVSFTLLGHISRRLGNPGRGENWHRIRSMVGYGGSVATALEIYRVHMGEYPDELRLLYENPDVGEACRWGGPYLGDRAYTRDLWGSELRYKHPGVFTPGKYDLWSVGPDGRDGSGDDIGNWMED